MLGFYSLFRWLIDSLKSGRKLSESDYDIDKPLPSPDESATFDEGPNLAAVTPKNMSKLSTTPLVNTRVMVKSSIFFSV